MTSTATPTTTIRCPELAAQLARLGLRATAATLDDLLAHATTARFAPRALLEHLVHLETADRSRKSLERRLRRSRVGSFKPMADFDWNWPEKIDRARVEHALGLDFVREGRNLVLLGPNGIGKTMIAKNLVYATIQAGYRALFRTAAELLDDLACDSPELRRRKIAAYARPDLLAIDEVGYLSYDDQAADLLYRVINPRYDKRRSLVVSTNLAFKDWGQVFPNATCIVTLVDRITHHCDLIRIEGKSYRCRESEEEAAARQARARP
jgi:DNA replication protein DnaC